MNKRITISIIAFVFIFTQCNPIFAVPIYQAKLQSGFTQSSVVYNNYQTAKSEGGKESHPQNLRLKNTDVGRSGDDRPEKMRLSMQSAAPLNPKEATAGANGVQIKISGIVKQLISRGIFLLAEDNSNRVTVYNITTGCVVNGLEALDVSRGFKVTATHIAIRDSYDIVTVRNLSDGSVVNGLLLHAEHPNFFELTNTHIAVSNHINGVTVRNLSDSDGKVVEGLQELDSYGVFELTDRHIAIKVSYDKVTVRNLNDGSVVNGLQGLDAYGYYGFELTNTHIAVRDSHDKVTVRNLNDGSVVNGLQGLDASGDFKLFKLTNTHIVARGSHGKVTVRNLNDGSVVNGLQGLDASGGFKLTNTHIVARGSHGKVTVRNLNDGSVVNGLQGLDALGGFELTNTHIAVSNQKKRLTVRNLNDGSVVKGLQGLDASYGFELTNTYIAIKRDHGAVTTTVQNLSDGKVVSGLTFVPDLNQEDIRLEITYDVEGHNYVVSAKPVVVEPPATTMPTITTHTVATEAAVGVADVVWGKKPKELLEYNLGTIGYYPSHNTVIPAKFGNMVIDIRVWSVNLIFGDFTKKQILEVGIRRHYHDDNVGHLDLLRDFRVNLLIDDKGNFIAPRDTTRLDLESLQYELPPDLGKAWYSKYYKARAEQWIIGGDIPFRFHVTTREEDTTALPDFAATVEGVNKIKEGESQLIVKLAELKSEPATVLDKTMAVVFTPETAKLGFYHLAESFGTKAVILTTEQVKTLKAATNPAAVEQILKDIVAGAQIEGVETIKLCELLSENISIAEDNIVRINPATVNSQIQAILKLFGINVDNVQAAIEAYNIAHQIAIDTWA